MQWLIESFSRVLGFPTEELTEVELWKNKFLELENDQEQYLDPFDWVKLEKAIRFAIVRNDLELSAELVQMLADSKLELPDDDLEQVTQVISNLMADGKDSAEQKLLESADWEVADFQLLRLSLLSKTLAKEKFLEQVARVEETSDKVEEVISEPEVEEGGGEQPTRLAWAKGVGYGFDEMDDDEEYWDHNNWQDEQRKKGEAIEKTITALATHLENGTCKFDVLEESCILHFLHDYCKNNSVNDMTRSFELYTALFAVIHNMIQAKDTLSLFMEEHRGETLYDLLMKMHKNAVIVKRMADRTLDMNTNSPDAVSRVDKSSDQAHIIANIICTVFGQLVEALEMEVKQEEEIEDVQQDTEIVEEAEQSEVTEEDYIRAMRPLAFDMVDEMFSPHHYGHESCQMTRKLMKRLAAEFADFSESLPIHPNSSVFFRACEEDMTKCQMMVIPTAESPYDGGCFLFDVFFPSEYPQGPPKVNMRTTGHGSVYFNPNLYQCGKVCLSLLGTWDGEEGESWMAGVSGMLQVAISVQSLIFVKDPYFNEPGYEIEMGTPEGDDASREYDEDLYPHTVQYAMIEMLEEPPKFWEDVIRTHFRLSKDRVMTTITKWLGADHEKVIKMQELLDAL